MADDQFNTFVIVIFAVVGCLSGLRWRASVQGTTLTAVVVWTTVSLAVMATVELVAAIGGNVQADSLDALRLAAATSVFCPVIARLGAKRPQQGAWQFVVATLWLMLASPAAEQFILQPDQPLEVAGVRSWFLMLLVVVSWFDRILTRYTLLAGLAAIGQLLLLGAYLPLPSDWFGFDGRYCLGVVLVSVSVVMESFDLPRRRRLTDSWDTLWLDFRDRFGTLWGLRIVQRLNDAANRYDWNLRLTWIGFRRFGTDNDILPDSFSVAFENLLRRFVSPEWIASRQGNDVDCSTAKTVTADERNCAENTD